MRLIAQNLLAVTTVELSAPGTVLAASDIGSFVRLWGGVVLSVFAVIIVVAAVIDSIGNRRTRRRYSGKSGGGGWGWGGDGDGGC